MRRFGPVVPALLTMLLVLGSSGCGDDDAGDVADDPTPTASDSATASDGPAASDSPTVSDTGAEVEFDLVETITETAAGGATSTTAVPLTDDEAVRGFTSQFEREAMTTRIQDVVRATDVPDDMLLYGAVVAIGCDAPSEVSVTQAEAGLVITALKVPTPMPECFAPMTTVALVLVPTSAVG
jgi:hypothetical protein